MNAIKVFWLVVGLIILTVVIFLIRDETLDERGLVPDPVEVLPADDNTYTNLPDLTNLSLQEQAAIDELDPVITTLLSNDYIGDSLSVDQLRLIHAATTDFVLQTKRAIDLGAYQCPTLVNNFSFDREECDLSKVRTLASLMAVEAEYYLKTGRTEQSFDTSLSMLKFGRLVASQDHGSALSVLTGLGVMQTGYQELTHLTKQTGIELTHDQRWAINGEQVFITTLARMIQVKFAVMKDYFQSEIYTRAQEDGTTLSPGYRYQPGRTLNRLAAIERRQLTMSVTPCVNVVDFRRNKGLVDQLVGDVKTVMDNPLNLLLPNFKGKLLLPLALTDDPDLIREKLCMVNAELQALSRKEE